MNVKPTTWTIAYRKPRANRFQRVTNWHGTWNDAHAVAREFANTYPELQVFYVVTLASSQNGDNPEDAGNILVDSGKRVRIIDNGALSGDVLAYAISLLMDDAIEHNACIDEAYIGKAEDAGMSIPAYRACLDKHTADGDIFLSGLWTYALLSDMTKVVTFEEGTRYGVSASDASMFTGKVTDMPKGEMSTCVHCNSDLLTPAVENDSIAEVIRFANEAIDALMPSLAATKLAFETLRDGESANPNHVGIAYQVYSDTRRAIEEYRRTIAYARS